MMIENQKESRTDGGISLGRLWTARFMSGIVVLFMLVDGIGKISKPAQVVIPR